MIIQGDARLGRTVDGPPMFIMTTPVGLLISYITISVPQTYALVGADPTPLVTVAIDRRSDVLEVEATADLAVLVNAELILVCVLGVGELCRCGVCRSNKYLNLCDQTTVTSATSLGDPSIHRIHRSYRLSGIKC
jgi:hypothetical protein